MRRIVARHVLIDESGHDWTAVITIPWVDRPSDTVKYGPDACHGPSGPLVEFQTPNDPEHELYGEDGPTFDVAYLRTIVALADRKEADA